jgi:hypothetical protein
MLGCAGRIDCQTAQPRVPEDPDGVAKAAAKGTSRPSLVFKLWGSFGARTGWVQSTKYSLQVRVLRYEPTRYRHPQRWQHTQAFAGMRHSLEPINNMNRWKEPYHHPRPPQTASLII